MTRKRIAIAALAVLALFLLYPYASLAVTNSELLAILAQFGSDAVAGFGKLLESLSETAITAWRDAYCSEGVSQFCP